MWKYVVGVKFATNDSNDWLTDFFSWFLNVILETKMTRLYPQFFFARYLHEVSSPSVVHKNIKSANILLDTELNPHLSDSGLASYIPHADQVILQNFGT